MINHARNLLMNTSGNDFQRLGEEVIDPAFVPKDLTRSSAVTAVRRVLFGSNPDAEMLNYRCRQYLSLLHASELADYVTALDSRITYSLSSVDLFHAAGFIPQSETVRSDDAAVVFTGGSVSPPDYTGRMTSRWNVDLTGVTAGPVAAVRILRHDNGTATSTNSSVSAAGVSEQITLPGSTVSFMLLWPTNTPLSDTTGSWRFTARRRPELGFAELESAIRLLGEATTDLFNRGSSAGYAEPFATLYNTWQTHPLLVYRFGALLLALVYKMDSL